MSSWRKSSPPVRRYHPERTDDPDPGDIPDILLNAFQRHGNIFPADLPQDAVVGLHSGLDALDGIAVIFQGILLIQHLEFRLHLHDGTLIIRHQLVHGALILLDQIQNSSESKCCFKIYL